MFVVACVSNDVPRPQCNELADGGVPIRPPSGSVYFGVPTTDAQTPEMLGLEPDPGPTCTDCQQANDVDVLLIHDFEEGFAPTWFNYGEPGVEIAPPQVGPGIAPDGGPATVPSPYWGLQVPDLDTLPGGSRCGSKYALHMAGGRFLSWGGGYVSRFVTVRGDGVNKYCGDVREGTDTGVGTVPTVPIVTDPNEVESCGFWITPVAAQPSLLGMDASDYEGISFWARRSPGAQSSLRIALNDDNTSEGLALHVERGTYDAERGEPGAVAGEPACRRTIECCRHCSEIERDAPVVDGSLNIVGTRKVTERRCRLDIERPPPELRVGDSGLVQFKGYVKGRTASEWTLTTPEWDNPGGYTAGAYRTNWDEWDRDFKLCCPLTMEEEEERFSTLNDMARLGDPQFGGRECNQYVFNYDYSSGYYCWAPGDPPLPERNENRCGDAFEATLVIDTEWRFYKVPWGELRRFTPNRAPFDPRGVWSVALFFGAGYLDTYVDDIGFYRKRR